MGATFATLTDCDAVLVNVLALSATLRFTVEATTLPLLKLPSLKVTSKLPVAFPAVEPIVTLLIVPPVTVG